MITTINNANGETRKCSYTFRTRSGQIYYKNENGNQPTTEFLTARGLVWNGETETRDNGVIVYPLQLAAGWSVDAKPAKPATDGAPAPKPTKPATTETAPVTETEQPAPVVVETKPTKPAKPATKPNNGGQRDALAQMIANAIADYMPKPETAPVTERHEITINGTAAGNVNGLVHKQFNRILRRAAARQNIYLYGAAGSGKSHTAQQIADALKLPFYCQMQIVSKYDVIGFVDAGGNYQPTPFYNAYKNGGVILFDEYERGDAAGIITLNGALANGYITFPNGEKVTQNPDFVFISAGNTNGLGNTDEYVTACQLDASSLDRVGFIRMDYDTRLENEFSKNDPKIAEFCRDLRHAASVCGVSLVVSYRAIISIAKFVDTDEKTDLLDEYILKGRDNDTAAVLYGALTDKTNPWAVALQKIATGNV